MLDKSTDQGNDVMVAPFVFPFLARTILKETSTETDDKTIKIDCCRFANNSFSVFFFFFFPKRHVIYTSEDNKFSRVYVIKRTGNFRSSKTSFSDQGYAQNLSCENEFYSREKKQSFSY